MLSILKKRIKINLNSKNRGVEIKISKKLKKKKNKNIRIIKKNKEVIFINNNLNNLENFEFFNLICGNIFQNFLSTGKNKHITEDMIMKKYLGNFEYSILSFFHKLEKGQYSEIQIKDLLKDNIFIKNIYIFFILLKSLEWKDFFNLSKRINLINNSNLISCNSTLTLLEFLKKLLNLNNLIKLFINGSINENHLKIAINKYKLKTNIYNLVNNTEITDIFAKITKNKNIKLNLLFSNSTLGFYDTLITRYNKYFLYSNLLFKPELSLFLKRKRKKDLNAAKSRRKLSYAQRLAIAYVGKPYNIPFAKKRINLRYRAYRIFLYAFKFKPFKLWQLTRKSREFKYGGLLLDHLSRYELNIQNILLMANFCITLNQVKDFLREGFVCINNKIILTPSFIIKPFDILHFTEEQFRIQRNNFLLNLYSSFDKNIFNKEFSQLFEYNFKSFCCSMLPNFLKYRKLSISPYYTIYNSGRFKIEKN